MNTRIRKLAVHGLHLFALTLLGYFVWQDLRRDGEARLFQSMNITQEFARGEMLEAQEKILGLVRRQSDAYRNETNQTYLNRATRISQLCDSVELLLCDGRLSAVHADHSLSALKDSLRANVDADPELSAQFERSLLRTGALDLVKFLSKASVSQQAMLRISLRSNVLLAKGQALNYISSKFSGCEIRLDPFQPFWQPNVICPMINESFSLTGFLGAYTPYYLRPQNAKVWVNGMECTVKNGYGPFSTRFDKTGPQPLAVRIEMHGDSTRVFEKTYTVNVK